MYALEIGSSISLEPEQKVYRECVFDGKDAFVCLPICLPFMFDKKLGRDNSLVVIVHRYI